MGADFFPIVSKALPSAIVKAVPTGTAEPISSASAIGQNGFLVQAPASNTAIVTLGPSGVVAGEGILLSPGQSARIGIADASSIFCIAGSASQTLVALPIGSDIGIELSGSSSASGGGGGGDGATAENQDEQTAELESIATNTLVGTGWFPAQSKKYLSMTPGGIDLTTAVPGKRAIAIMGSRTATNGSVIQLEFVGNASGELVDLNFGPGFVHYGQWKKIDATSTAGCFPLFVLFV